MLATSVRRHASSRSHLRVLLADGEEVVLRPLRREETDVLQTVFDGLSPRSREHRYLVPMPRLTGHARRSLMDIDGHRHVAWVALLDGRPVAICRYVRTGPDSAEVAFEVVDTAQGRGIASALLDAVAADACASGIAWFEATVEPGNAGSVALLHRIGLRLTPVDGLLEGRGRLCPRQPRTALVPAPRACPAPSA
ncbi:MAG TPA: GNAT family N-acetyltransferase [Nocardioides sp.]|nr:GNAT family N-acetyltransferase [Nocardioides sp.]